MKLTHLIAAAVCGMSLQVVAADRPLEVEKYLEKRRSCDHWRGEDGYDKEREADISWFVCQSCRGVDAELARLKKKYDPNPEVMEVLSELAPEVEPKDKEETERFCKTTRKPKWYRKRSN